MSTKKQEKEGIKESNEKDENNIKHLYFDRTPPKNWKLGDVLQYYLKQNVPIVTVFDLIEKSLEKCIETRESLKKQCLALMQELKV